MPEHNKFIKDECLSNDNHTVYYSGNENSQCENCPQLEMLVYTYLRVFPLGFPGCSVDNAVQ